MIIIGLTGGSGTGKGTVASCFEKLGAGVINADTVYHDLVRHSIAMLAEITEEFGEDMLDENGELDRKALGQVVFSSAHMLDKLNLITHKYITEEAARIMVKMQEEGKEICIFDAPVLFEAHFEDFCDKVIGVISKYDLRIERVVLRDNVTREYAGLRINAQKKDEFYIERCDYIIENNGAIEKLNDTAYKIFEEVSKLKNIEA